MTRNTHLRIFTLLMALSSITPLIAAPQTKSPPLVETLKFIEGKLNSQGKVENPDHSSSVIVSGAVADPSTCRLTWQEDWTQGQETWVEQDEFSFKQVDRLEKLPTGDGVSLKITLTTGATAHYHLLRHNGQFDTRDHDGKLPTLTLGDEQLADRVAKAIIHAVELCGGGNKDPF